MVSKDVNRPASTGSQQEGHVSDRISQLSTHCKWYWCIHGRYRMLSPKNRRKHFAIVIHSTINHRFNTHQQRNRSCKCRIRSELSSTWSCRLCIDGWANAGWVRFALRFLFVHLRSVAARCGDSCPATGKISAECSPGKSKKIEVFFIHASSLKTNTTTTSYIKRLEPFHTCFVFSLDLHKAFFLRILFSIDKQMICDW